MLTTKVIIGLLAFMALVGMRLGIGHVPQDLALLDGKFRVPADFVNWDVQGAVTSTPRNSIRQDSQRESIPIIFKGSWLAQKIPRYATANGKLALNATGILYAGNTKKLWLEYVRERIGDQPCSVNNRCSILHGYCAVFPLDSVFSGYLLQTCKSGAPDSQADVIGIVSSDNCPVCQGGRTITLMVRLYFDDVHIDYRVDEMNIDKLEDLNTVVTNTVMSWRTSP